MPIVTNGGSGGGSGLPGPRGYNGWSEVTVNVVDGERVVQQLVDWIGGTGNKPVEFLNQYKTQTGYTTDISLATDVKGNKGDKGEQGIQGVKGDTGATGAQGEQGIQGVKGDTGATGAQGEQGIQGVKGDTGATGAQGEQGTQGGPGLDGTNGTNGIDGQDGVDGESAYQIALNNGFVGTEQEWLASLKDEKGDTGDTGATGLTGPKGDTGDIGPQGPSGDPATNLVTSVNGEIGDVVLDAVKTGAEPLGSVSTHNNDVSAHPSILNEQATQNLEISNLQNDLELLKFKVDSIQSNELVGDRINTVPPVLVPITETQIDLVTNYSIGSPILGTMFSNYSDPHYIKIDNAGNENPVDVKAYIEITYSNTSNQSDSLYVRVYKNSTPTTVPIGTQPSGTMTILAERNARNEVQKTSKVTVQANEVSYIYFTLQSENADAVSIVDAFYSFTSQVVMSPAVSGVTQDYVDQQDDAVEQFALEQDVIVLQQANTYADTKESSIAGGLGSEYWTGTKTWRNFMADVRATVLTGLDIATSAVIDTADTVLSALGKLQAQISNKADKASGAEQITDPNAYANLGTSENATQATINTAVNTKLYTSVFNSTLLVGTWSNNTYTITDARFIANIEVDITPQTNADADKMSTAGFYPNITVNVGSIVLSCTTTPTANIAITIKIRGL